MLYRDRKHAGRVLAQALAHRAGRDDVVVLGLPRGGVPVAAEVADALGVPLDVFVVRPIAVPGHEELTIGALASGEVIVQNPDVIEALELDEDDIEAAVMLQRTELARQERIYRDAGAPLDVADKQVILVDDGTSEGASLRAAVQALRARTPKAIIVALPLAPAETCDALEELVDEVICAASPQLYRAASAHYAVFPDVADEDVHRALMRARTRERSGKEGEVRIPVAAGSCAARLSVPPQARGIVVFAHGSGSGRNSPRNRRVAEVLQRAGFATLLADLLTEDEESADELTGAMRSDIGFLAERLSTFIEWLARSPHGHLPVGLFGASTGAAAALLVAAQRPDQVRAVVARGGRPDLAADALPDVRAPVLFVVGELDEPVLELNRNAVAQMGGPAALVVVPHAGHLLEEPEALAQVSEQARAWFDLYLARVPVEEPAPPP